MNMPQDSAGHVASNTLRPCLHHVGVFKQTTHTTILLDSSLSHFRRVQMWRTGHSDPLDHRHAACIDVLPVQDIDLHAAMESNILSRPLFPEPVASAC